MKRILVLLSLLILLAMPISLHGNMKVPSGLTSTPLNHPPNQTELSYVNHEGRNRDTTIYASRDVSSYTLRVSNSYGSISQHTGEINFSQYQIPGWSLYRAEISPSLIQAIPERESTGITPNNNIQITNSSGLVTDSLYQEFYNQPYDGKLVNFTILYSAPYYLLSLGKAYLVVRSDYSDSSTNTTGWTTPFTQTLTDTYVTQNCQADNAILNKLTPYYAVIDGEALIGVDSGGWKFNQINWKASNLVQGADTGYHIRGDTWYPYTGLQRQEAYLTYMYTPWNTTTDSELIYKDATQVALLANTSAVSGSKWVFSNNNGLTRIDFESNESVDIDCSLVLWYKQDSTSVANWVVESSGSIVKWNITATTEYPKSADQRFLNYSLPTTWIPTGLFSSSMPSSNHSSYSISADTVTCSNMSNETWTLMASSYNHVLQISIFNSGDNSPISEAANGNWILEINTTMADENEMPVATGTTNLTIWKGNQVVYSPSNQTASNGETSYSWDIASITSDNGLFRIEVYWANDTESGYLSRDLVIYHSTTLTPDQSHVQGFTEATVEIRVDYEDAYNFLGINGTSGSVSYSFDGSSNTTMTDLTNGTWVGVISTAGENPGTYIADVYATGFALENQTSQISITLIHQTKNLTVQWSATNNITYVEHTNLIVIYQRTSGENVTGAEVNVTIGSTTWSLRWDVSNNFYVMRFNGTDNDPGFGTHLTMISAWKAGYQGQTDATQTITLREEPTSISVQWSAGSSITYIGATTVSISYRMSNGTPIPFATANITIGGSPYILEYDPLSQTYNYTFFGDATQPGFGIYSLDIRIGKTGYEGQTNTDEFLSISEEPTSLTIQWTNTDTITYVQQTILRVNYTMSNGSAVVAAQLNFTIDTVTDSLYWDESYGSYVYVFHGDNSFPGFGFHNIIILADKYGYVYRMNNTQTITVSFESTTLVVSVVPDSDVTYTEYSTVIAEYRMSDNSAVTGAIVNVTLGTGQWLLRWDSINQDYRIRINGSDSPPGFGTFTIAVEAACYGFVNQTDSSKSITLRREPTVLSFQWSNGNNISFVDYTFLQVNYSRTSGIQISDAVVNVTIGSTTWNLTWNGASGFYEIQFNGTDSDPGFGNHSIIVKAYVFGFEGRTNSTGNLVLREEFTSLTHSWVSSNTITYVDQTTLNVTYRMSNGTAIPNAILNVTINTKTWPLLWNESTQSYVITFNGTDTLPGFGTHSLVILADKFGYVGKTDDSDSLKIDLEGTSLTVALVPDNDITFTESSVLIADYEMSNGSAVMGADVNVTIDSNVWTLAWDSGNQDYRIQLNGSDIPPGFGTYNIVVKAGLFGYIQQMNDSLDVTLRIEPTSFSIQWSNGNDLSYFDSTVLQVNYTMTDNTPIPSAEVNATIGLNTWALHWNSTSGFFELRFNGSDVPPGVGTHSLSIKAWVYGYEGQSDSTHTLTLPVIPTSMHIIWTNGYDISYVESTTLIVNYTMFNGTAVTAAAVNVTFGLTTWDLTWNAGAEVYEVTFNGDEDPPGIAAYSLTIEASRTDFQYWVDSTQTLSVSPESTSYVISWTAGFNISYLESTTLSLSYKMSNGTAIPDAVVVVTLASTPLTMKWNGATGTYEITFNGTDAFPGFGTYPLVIQGSKFGYVSVSDNNEELTVRVEDTSLVLTWTAGSTISYISETILRAEYLLRDFSMVSGATINVTIGGHTWQMNWNATSGYYQIKFNGTDALPGLGTHTIVVSSWKQDYQTHVDSAQTLTINKENTSLSISWSNGSTITYVEFTTLSVNYTMSSGSAVELAEVNVTIGSTTWRLRWDSSSNCYVMRFNGTDNDPGFGTHSTMISAWKAGYQSQTDTTQSITLSQEPTSISVQWSAGNSITYVESTTLSISYTMSNSTPIPLATANVTIGGIPYTLLYDPLSQMYNYTFFGNATQPGFGIYALDIRIGKAGYEGQTNTDEILSISEEPTSLAIQWTNTNTITYVQQTILRVNYTMSNGSAVELAEVNVTIGLTTWMLHWNTFDKVYVIQFNGTDADPGLGTHGLLIQAGKYGYQQQANSSLTLKIIGELGQIDSKWSNTGIISYVGFTVLSVNYTMSNGTAITLATVNVTIGVTVWQLAWNEPSHTYRIQFNGTDDPPGIGVHSLFIKAWRQGFDYAPDTSMTLTINEEATTLVPSWSSPYLNNISYFQSTTLRVSYQMSNGSDITSAIVNVTVSGSTWQLTWNPTGRYYEVKLNGSDIAPSFGTLTVTIRADAHGYQYLLDSTQGLTVRKDPSMVEVTWPTGFNITYIEHTKIAVYYRMSNGTAIADGVVNITVAGQTYALSWNSTSEAYERVFYGTQNPPGLGTFACTVKASGPVYTDQMANTLFVIRTESTSVSIWWVNAASDSNSTFYYSQTDVLRVYYRDSLGAAITGATKKVVTVNGTLYTLTEDAGNGFYWYQFTYLTGLGYHAVTVNMSKSGYEYAFLGGIYYNITPNPTQLYVTWDATTVDYLGQVNLTAQYWDVNLARDVSSPVTANLTIDGSITISLNSSGKIWTANLTGMFLDLGAHSILVRAWRYGFQYQENMTVITINSVQTDTSYISWEPSNVTIQYTQSINLTLDYSFASGDVPDLAQVNLTINSVTYGLAYTGSVWFISIPGIQIGLGVYDAHISAWLYGYEAFSNTTYGVNVTLASNSFLVTWEPISGSVDIIDEVNISVIYTSAYMPILDATVTVTLNETRTYQLVYSSLDQKWHISLSGFEVTLGVWNATILANRTGQQLGTEWKLFTVNRDTLQTSTSWVSTTTDYVSSKMLDVRCNSSKGQAVNDATVSITVGTTPQDVKYEGMGVYTATLGPYLSPGTYTVNVTISGIWFYSATLLLSLYVNETLTSLDISFSNTTIYTDEAITGSISYVMLNGSDVPSGAVEILVNGISLLPQWNGVNWSFAIEGDIISPGSYECYINTTSFGFESQKYKFTLSIHLIPTDYEISGRNWLYVNDTIEIQIRYIDTRTNDSVGGASVSVGWTGAYVLTAEPTGLYTLQLSSDALHSGNYSLQVSFAYVGCESISFTHAIAVKPLPIEIISELTLIQYEQEPVQIVAYLVDSYHQTNVTWGTLTAMFQGVDYQLSYSLLSGTYSAVITLSDQIAPGEYEIRLRSDVPDFIQSEKSLTLNVLEKMTYTLSITAPQEAYEGNQITIAATLLHGSDPVDQRSIIFLITTRFLNGSSTETPVQKATNSSGVASLTLTLPSDTNEVSVSAQYEGEIDAWPADSEARVIDVKQIATEPNFPLSGPLTVSLVVGGCASFAVVIVLMRKRRHHVRLPTNAISVLSESTHSLKGKATSVFSGFKMLSGESLSIHDTTEVLSDSMGIASDEVESYLPYLASLGIATSVSLSTGKRTVRGIPTDTTDAARVVDLLRNSTKPLTRKEISDLLNISSSQIRKIIAGLLRTESAIIETKVGRSRKLSFRKPE